MNISPLQNKSTTLVEAANLLHNKGLYPAVAHSAYYCCVQLMTHIWLYSLGKQQDELTKGKGTHNILINEIGKHIKSKKGNNISREFNNKITKLKTLRVNADYRNEDFNIKDSKNSLSLSEEIVPILQKIIEL